MADQRREYQTAELYEEEISNLRKQLEHDQTDSNPSVIGAILFRMECPHTETDFRPVKSICLSSIYCHRCNQALVSQITKIKERNFVMCSVCCVERCLLCEHENSQCMHCFQKAAGFETPSELPRVETYRQPNYANNFAHYHDNYHLPKFHKNFNRDCHYEQIAQYWISCCESGNKRSWEIGGARIYPARVRKLLLRVGRYFFILLSAPEK